MLITADRSCLLVIDIQDKLAPTMADTQMVIDNTALLLKAAGVVEVPILVSEQYPRGLGQTLPQLATLMPPDSKVEKMHFSCMGDDGFARRFRGTGRSQAVLVGIEAHVCVLQTAEQLIEAGCDVFVVADATSSRTTANYEAALARMRADGAQIVTTEMVAFEWLERAGTPEFKKISALIK
jgi:nicotinamidase-related amidase